MSRVSLKNIVKRVLPLKDLRVTHCILFPNEKKINYTSILIFMLGIKVPLKRLRCSLYVIYDGQ